MKILLIGAAGKLGTAVNAALTARGHEVLAAGRSSGDLRYDIADPAQTSALYDRVGPVDAVASAAGDVPYKPVVDMAPENYEAAFRGKVLSQIELVRQGVSRIAERGSFTLITGVLCRDPIPTSSAAAMANGAVEAFVRAAAIEIAPQRINAISPTVFTESLAKYGDFFPGVPPVDLAQVAQAYVRSIEGAHTGRIYELS
ncbi:NAD(P)-dependent dehydrogenase (short-subunit alcohol dehydrogenase family) [Saccharopolyspora erythraea NRRL 2338]|uniref:Short-chain alcohol dehydrogenase-like protein n=2 Tax=Saccharopolyspora erythraea TaxID=1836 RepID=A4FIR2_SACEN|nr:short chain dehydrogenase [Saccharopolyspora erythraea]EQD85890.1 short-chain dehydrogenase [Saccharopolyspora erythraea D]PFG97613.1 NAD(P)-dependent dehydrogenase (short-subunit alcohol dehydrogenase family) [Saccharopolyspora erythraea NRRL 2338]QRK87772.1 short chain dehydrogenase [Saccharopolyspora erythraea]CAM03937.1 short-chain alcohol dehydrogenase-like protein [Saccharopolyspora erythraea NRRL 2338]